MHPEIEYVLFDMDGLMIDSERIYTEVASNDISLIDRALAKHVIFTDQILRPYGKEMTWDIKAGCMGKPELASTEYLLSFFPDIPLSVDSYIKKKNELQDQLWPTMPLLPGVRELIHHLKAHNIPMAVATSSRRDKFNLKTKHLGEVFDCFEGKVVCGDDKQYGMRGKPQPDIFLAAARELLGRDVGYADKECSLDQLKERAKGLVFEDSLPGVQAGKRAGMSVVWIPDNNLLDVEYSEVERADQTLKSMKEFVPEEWSLPVFGESV